MFGFISKRKFKELENLLLERVHFYQGENDDLETELDNAKQQIQSLMDTANSTIEKHTLEMQEQSERYHTLKEDFDRLVMTKEELEKKLTDANNDKVQDYRAIEISQNRAKTLEQESSLRKNEIEQLQQEKYAMQTTIDALKEETASLEKQLTAAKNKQMTTEAKTRAPRQRTTTIKKPKVSASASAPKDFVPSN